MNGGFTEFYDELIDSGIQESVDDIHRNNLARAYHRGEAVGYGKGLRMAVAISQINQTTAANVLAEREDKPDERHL